MRLINALLCLVLIACAKEEKLPSQVRQEPKIATSITETEASELYQNYLLIKDAFVKSDAATVNTLANEMNGKFIILEDSLYNRIKESVKVLSSLIELDEQRLQFQALSNEMILMAASVKSSEGIVYKQFCPMAFNNTGAYWLSDKYEIRNPYFGDKMLKCGTVRAEITHTAK